MLSRGESCLETSATQSSMDNSVDWILDSASDCHVCTNKDVLTDLRQDDGPLVFDWEGKPSKSRGRVGEVDVQVKNEDQPAVATSFHLSNVLYTANGTNDLLSLDKLEKDGWDFCKPKKQTCAWLRKGGVSLKLSKIRGRYRLETTAIPVQQVEAVVQAKRDDERALVRWHARLGHLNFGALQQMVREGTVDGLELSGSVRAPKDRCWTCVRTKMKRFSYKKVTTDRAQKPYQKMVSDECFFGEPTYNDYFHFQLVMDEASRYVWGFLLKRKEEASDVVMKHLEWIIARGHRVGAFGSDGGGELINHRFKAFLRTHGIALAKTNAYSPEENGLVERMHGVVLSRVRSLLTMVDLPNLLWVKPSTLRWRSSMSVQVLHLMERLHTPAVLETDLMFQTCGRGAVWSTLSLLRS
jgi:transposase InsO family protein